MGRILWILVLNALDEVINDRLENDKEDILNDIDAKIYAEREENSDEKMP